MRPGWTFTVVVVAALVLANCGGGAKRAATQGAGASATSVVEDTTSTTAAPAAAAGAGASTTVRRTTPTAAPRAGAARAGSAAGATGGPAPATPVPAGTYRYDTTGSTQSSGGANHPMPSVTTLVADKPAGATQHATRDLRDPNGQGQTVETVLVYQADGVHVQEIKVTTVLGGGVTDVRDVTANPPPLIARTGAAPGDRYEFTLTGSGTTFHGVVAVQRLEQLVVGGQPVTTAVTKLDVDFSGSVTGHQSATDWVEGSHLLNVKEQVVTDAKAGALQTHTEYSATLQRLAP